MKILPFRKRLGSRTRFFRSIDCTRRIGFCGIIIFRQRSFYRKNARISIWFWIRSATEGLRHLEYFPVEVNRADYQTLLRVPGIGYTSARRIVRARRTGTLDFTDLKKMGVVLKRALYFVTCKGKMMYPIRMDEIFIFCRIFWI